MGYASYSTTSRSAYVATTALKSQQEIFSSKLHPTMSPKNMTIRECRDSTIHPESIPIIIGLDVTGSMGYIPEHIIKQSLSDIIENIMSAGISDPSIMFIAIGDHISDNAPLQVGQFESGDSELAMWLERTYIEGRGGGNDKESYLLAWKVAKDYVVTDHWDKRNKKGILITIGDERTHKELNNLTEIFGIGQSVNHTELLTEIKEKWEVYHIHADDGSYPVSSLHGKRVIDSWNKILGQKALVVPNHINIGKEIAKIVIDVIYSQKDASFVPKNELKSNKDEIKPTNDDVIL
jgi:hypothetical protein